MHPPRSTFTETIRGLRSDEDYEAVAGIAAACRIGDAGDPILSAAQVHDMLTAWGVDPTDHLRLAEVDGEVVGFAFGCLDGDHRELGRILFHAGGVLPGRRGRGIGRALLAEAQHAAVRQAADRAGPGPATAVFRVFVPEADADTRRLLEADGYAVVRHAFSMVRPTLDSPPPPDLPPGIECRPATPANALRILQAMAEAMADHWGTPEYTDADLATFPQHPMVGQLDVWQVAWEGDEVVGGVLGFVNDEENSALGRRRGYTENIFTRRPWRGRGIASALIGRNLRLLAELGMTEAALKVDAENLTGALALYERTGFVRHATELVYQRPA